MLERDAPLARLRALLDGIDDGGGRMVLVRGEAGIGKTTLVSRFLRDAARRSDVYVGACDDLGTPQPLGPIWDVARDRPDVAATLADGERRRVMDALLDLLSPPGRTAVLVIEDTQWADEATLDVITLASAWLRWPSLVNPMTHLVTLMRAAALAFAALAWLLAVRWLRRALIA
ncbi:MAG TPA: ATP-binding protein [Euzebyales bacterium]